MSEAALSDEIEDLRINLNGAFAKISALSDEVERLKKEKKELEDNVEEAHQIAYNALGAAQAVNSKGAAPDGGVSKTARAKNTARNELVKRVLLDSSAAEGASLTVGEVQTMLKPQTEVAYQTVKNGFGQLVEEWRPFRMGENSDGKRALKIDSRELTQELVGAVEVDLERRDLTKRFMSRHTSGGGE